MWLAQWPLGLCSKDSPSPGRPSPTPAANQGGPSVPGPAHWPSGARVRLPTGPAGQGTLNLSTAASHGPPVPDMHPGLAQSGTVKGTRWDKESRNPSGGRTDLGSKDGSTAVERNATRARANSGQREMMFFPQTEEKISWYLKRALKKSYSVGTRKSKTSPSAEPVWAQLKGHAGTDTGMQARQPGTETRVIFQPNTALTLQRQTWRTKATTRRLFRGRSCVVHGAVRRKSERTALSRETFLPSFARRYTRCNVKTCSLQIMNPDIWVF